ncbi:MAG: hypothetical protein ACT4PO_16485 [Actinomycetota bacterium]
MATTGIGAEIGEARETLHARNAIILSGEPVSGWRNPDRGEAQVV